MKKGEQWRKGYQNGFDEAMKACGNCKYCYGKGYSTSNEDQIVLGDFIGERPYHHKRIQIMPCSCDRGKQIHRLFIAK